MNVANLPRALVEWATHFADAGRAHEVDPFLLAAICWRESRGGSVLKPPGPAGVGDGGHGRGLMQIDNRAWKDWVFQTPLDKPQWQDPRYNILKGAEILSGYVGELGAELPGVAAYNAGPGAVRAVLKRSANVSAHVLLHRLDLITTGKNYVSDVLATRSRFTPKSRV
jgi:soluble lytic murein transglycosylase-like protein